MNKIDLLEQKLPYSPLQPYFEDFPGPEGNFDAACDYFRRRFLSLSGSASKRTVTHFTCATDTRSFVGMYLSYLLSLGHVTKLVSPFPVVMRAINEHILKANLEQVGFV